MQKKIPKNKGYPKILRDEFFQPKTPPNALIVPEMQRIKKNSKSRTLYLAAYVSVTCDHMQTNGRGIGAEKIAENRSKDQNPTLLHLINGLTVQGPVLAIKGLLTPIFLIKP